MPKAKQKKELQRLSHIDAGGAARMVDISAKPATARTAVASAWVSMKPATLKLIEENRAAKGDVLGVARIAGIQAAKGTWALIPLCHPLSLTSVAIDVSLVPPDRVSIIATVQLTARTGAEMEALTAASVAALTVYDMCKSADRAMVIGPVQLERKSGGKSGSWSRSSP
jgi:cyclic pyranopterin phosphate synthase